MGNLIESLNWRYATKEFDSTKKVSDKDLETLIESLRLSASSFGLQPWKFFIISNKEVKEQLLPHSWNQKQVVDCSHHIVFCAPSSFGDTDIDRFLTSTAEQRNAPLETLDGYGKMMKGFLANKSEEQKYEWMKNQIYIALGSFLVSCAHMGIDSCPMEGIIQSKYDETLGLKEKGWRSVVACPIGYRSSDDKYANLAKVRYSAKDIIEFI